MGVTKVTQEFTSQVACDRLFEALIVESNTLIPKLVPQVIKSVDILQGDGGAGSIEQVNFAESSPFKYAKHQIDELNKEKFICKYRMIEGDVLGDKLEFIAYDVEFEASGDGGCVCKMTTEYHTLGECEVTEEEVRGGKEGVVGVYKIVEAYLLENPNVYA